MTWTKYEKLTTTFELQCNKIDNMTFVFSKDSDQTE